MKERLDKFVFRNLSEDYYYDDEYRKMAVYAREAFARYIMGLIDAGQKEEAKKYLARIEKEVPFDIIEVTIQDLRYIQLYELLDMPDKAKKMIKDHFDKIEEVYTFVKERKEIL